MKSNQNLHKKKMIKKQYHFYNPILLSSREYLNSFIFRITYYATASTRESVLIIGGYTKGSPPYSSTIAEYKDGSWKNVGNLAQARHGHGAITSGSVTMVVGGQPNGGGS